MALIGRLHPLLIHFPIALVLAAAAAEAAAGLTRDERWRLVAIKNLRAGALSALVAAAAGWLFARGADASAPLEWHRWLGTTATLLAAAAALAAGGAVAPTSRGRLVYRIALGAATALLAVAAHLGGVLVWGADFLRP